jgi:membrane associated rhomboid family serine protease
MLSDRPYMRGEYPRERTSALTWLVSAMIAGFVLQLAMGTLVFRNGSRVEDLFGLTTSGLREGAIWTLLTHAFLHSTEFIVHGLFNILALYFLGRELLPMLGTRRFLGVFAVATAVGGLAWSTVHWQSGNEMHIGATAAVNALFVVFACFFPRQRINFLLFFVVPVTLTPKQVALALAGIGLVGLFGFELPGNALPFDVTLASSAHLGGMLTGYLYARFVHEGRWFRSEDGAELELPRWIKPAKRPAQLALPVETKAAAPASREDLRAEVDRILDKINSHGFGALTAEEKRLLDGAKDLLSRR